MKRIREDKAVGGTEILLSVVVFLFIIGLLVMIFVLMSSELQESTYDETATASFTNISVASVVNGTGSNVTTYNPSGYRSCALTVTRAINNTNNVLIHSGNYTVTNCYIRFTSTFAGDASAYNNTLWNITGTITYSDDTVASDVINETTTELSNVTDWYAIFITITAMVVLILLTVIIITAIRGSGLISGESTSGGINPGTA